MSHCNVCRKAIATTRQNSSIACSDCKKMCHSGCVNMTKDDVDCVVSQGQAWRCPPCAKTRRSSMTATPDKGKLDISHVINMLKEAKDDRRRMETEMGKAFEFVHKLIDDQKVIMNDQNKQVSEFIKVIEALQEENNRLKNKVRDLECRLEENEQYLRANTLEIHGIPELANEDTYEIVSKVGTALDMNISRDMVDICHRLGKRRGSDRPAGIIVKFVRREVKQNMLSKRREKKSNFTTENVGYQVSSGPSVVYVNESLSPGKRRVYAAAREAKRTKHYKYLWIRNGKIFMRQDDSAPAVTIASLEDIDTL